MAKTHEGYLLIADITGYTQYLNESELEHAQDTLTTLLEVLVDHTRPPLVISRLAGDAVISYGLGENFFQPQTFIEVIENTYVSFRKAIELMVLNNTCRCNACANVSSLDLKFFLHYGGFAIQRIAEHDELVGSEVNLLHRLLKNRVTEETGMRGYCLITEPALRRLGFSGMEEVMRSHSESYEHLGEVTVWVQDMHPVWESKRKATIISIPPDTASLTADIEFRILPEQLWDYVTNPEFRSILIGADRMEIANRDAGRTAPGSIYQCYHGDQLIPHTILEWQPFKQIVTQEVMPMINGTTYLREIRLDPAGTGTRLTMRLGKESGPLLGRTILWFMGVLGRGALKRSLETLKEKVEKDYHKRQLGMEADFQLNPELLREAATASLDKLREAKGD